MMKSSGSHGSDEEDTLLDEEISSSHVREKRFISSSGSDAEGRRRGGRGRACRLGPCARVILLIVGIQTLVGLIYVSSGGPRKKSLKEWLEGARSSSRFSTEQATMDRSAYVRPNITRSFRDALVPNQRYITDFIIMGWTNDVISYLHLIYLALLTNRIPIIGPFQPTHVGRDGGFMPTGEVFDLPRLSSAIHLPILEWHEVKNTSRLTPKPDDPMYDGYYGGETDEIGCWSVWMTQEGRGVSPRDGFIPEALGLDISYLPVPHRKPVPDDNYIDYNTHHLAELGFKNGRRRAIKESKEYWVNEEKERYEKIPMANRVGDVPSEVPLENKGGRRIDPDEQLLCFDFLYHTATHRDWEWWVESTPAWQAVGRHMHWAPPILGLAQSLLASAFELAPSQKFPPYISVHIRRNDFIDWCGGVVKDECLAPLSAYRRRVDQVMTELLAANEDWREEDVRIIVLSDELHNGTDVDGALWWDNVRNLGWKSVDHEALATAQTYGYWYPAILDACMLSLAQGFVGTYRSTYSLLAQRRVETWADGPTRMVNWGSVGADDGFLGFQDRDL